MINEFNDSNPGTSRQTKTLVAAPANLVSKLIFSLIDTTPAAATHMLVTRPSQTDTAPTTAARHLGIAAAGATVPQDATVPVSVRMSSSQQVCYRLSTSTADHTVHINTAGYIHQRVIV